jgi:hypothetical protein
MVNAHSSGPLRSVICRCMHSNLLQKSKKVKRPDGVSTVSTPMSKLKPKINIMLQRTIFLMRGLC